MTGAAADSNGGEYDLNNCPAYDLAPILHLYFGDNDDSNPYLNNDTKSTFYDPNDLISKFKNTNIPLILSFNTQCLTSKFDSFKYFIQDLISNNLLIIAIAVQEIWQIPSTQAVQLENFDFYFKTRTAGRGGGVGIYCNSNYSSKLIKDLSPFQDKIFESITIEFKYKKSAYLITSLYRSPENSVSYIDEFFAKLDLLLIQLAQTNHPSFIMGDLNFNLLKLTNCKLAQQYLERVHNNGFLQLITKATRIQNNTYSLLDHILHKNENIVSASGVITIDISDHLPIFLPIDKQSHHMPNKLIQYRDFSTNNVANFKNSLQDIGWEFVTTQTDVNEALNEFWDTFFAIFDLYFPLITKKFNRNIHKINKFMTTGLLISRTTKNNLHKLSMSQPTLTNISNFKNYRNINNSLVRKSKILLYQTELTNNVNNPKKHGKSLTKSLLENSNLLKSMKLKSMAWLQMIH